MLSSQCTQSSFRLPAPSRNKRYKDNSLVIFSNFLVIARKGYKFNRSRYKLGLLATFKYKEVPFIFYVEVTMICLPLINCFRKTLDTLRAILFPLAGFNLFSFHSNKLIAIVTSSSLGFLSSDT